eukprot:CAMPEP_0204584308 /NCGR_PEP_ID=MMETSP0661-20131031/46270_1 /ASSEMBLY_ACC=CAM_ASM_000606 /TAXON_ID=109239 /ORGANISM="Alexandrium margalefi, Strain AMGDE01CS-322" /LENGTH=385 /DNA_ID=CAMNT_0051593745 /DNA_START=93 /DNA_END=1253 /DNA_ORIENTATION=+
MNFPNQNAGSQEMQLMVAPSSTDVRDVHMVDGPGRSSDTSYVDLGRAEEGDTFLKRARRRVLVLSGLLVAYGIFSTLAQSALDAAEVSTIFNKVKDAGAPHLDVLSISLRSAPSAGMGILFVLAVSACGFCGARLEHRRLVGCFCSCNALCGCCSCVGMTVLVLGLMIAGMMSSTVKSFIERCDPYQCGPAGQDLKHMANLTALQIALQRGHGKTTPSIAGVLHMQVLPKGLLGVQRGTAGEDGMGAAQAQLWTASTRLTSCDGVALTMGSASAAHRPVEGLQTGPGAMEKFHRVSKALPELWPRLQLIFVSKALLAVISTTLMCCGAKWGWDLYQELGIQCMQGLSGMSGQLAEATVSAPMEMLSEEGALERSLVLHAPPPLTV